MPNYKKQWADNLVNPPNEDRMKEAKAKMDKSVSDGYYIRDEDWIQFMIAKGYDEAFVRKFFKELSEDLRR